MTQKQKRGPSHWQAIVILAASTCGLAACTGSSDGSGGGGGIPTSEEYTEFDNTSSLTPSPLTFVAITNTGTPSSGNAGTLAHNLGAITGGQLQGTLNGDLSVITLSSGGFANLSNPESTAEYLRIFRTEGTGSDLFGVVGQATNLVDMPDINTGSASYSGVVELQVDDGDATYALTGDAAITAFWMTSSVNSTFDELSGTRNDSEIVNDVGTISISNATIAGSGFSGGTLSTTGTVFDVTAGASIDGTNGQFFGPAADEVGGTIVIDDTDLSVLGVFIAD